MRGLSSWCPRVSLKFTSAHQRPACAFGQKTTLRAPRWRSSLILRSTESPDRQRSGWRPPKSGDQEDDGRPGYPRRGAGDPERRAEWTTVLRDGHLRSAPVVVGGDLRTEWEPPTLRASFHAGRLLDGFLPLQRRTCPAVCCHHGSPGLCCEAKKEVSGSEASDGSRKVQKFATYGQIPAFGLYMSLRHPILIACGSLSGSARQELASAANSRISYFVE